MNGTKGFSILLVVMLMLFNAVTVRSAQVIREVWFPDGIITWHATKFSANLIIGVRDAMDYLEQRTPIELTERDNGELEIRFSNGPFKGWYGGMTKGYRNLVDGFPLNKSGKRVRISSMHNNTANNVRNNLLHEMGHVLGFTHEFQRKDRKENGVSICAACSLDKFNFKKMDEKKVHILTPYDSNSRFSTGYDDVTPAPQRPIGALLSRHDINGLYRVYGRAFSSDDMALSGLRDSDRFGVAVTTGDYDGDNIEDIAVASVEGDAPRTVFINFFKGVITGPNDAGTGTSYMPWFRTSVGGVPDTDERVALASGDLMERGPESGAAAGRDNIDEVVVGIPGADKSEGLVIILTVNVEDRFQANDHPWGGKGIFHRTTLRPFQFGLDTISKFGIGASLVVARLSRERPDDLIIGAPDAIVSEPGRSARKAGLIVYLPGGDAASAIVIKNPSGATQSQFGAALSVVPDFHKVGNHRLDALVVGAAGENIGGSSDAGKVYIFGRAVNDASQPIVPPVIHQLHRKEDRGRFGTALAGFLINQGHSTWFPDFFLAVGHPGRRWGSAAQGGTVWLYEIPDNGRPVAIDSRSLSSSQPGAEFGAALAVKGANCLSGECTRANVWLAIGAPKAGYNSNPAQRGGKVYAWDIWTYNGELAGKAPVEIGSGSSGSEYGSAITAVRHLDSGGGFVIGIPDMLIPTGIYNKVKAGAATVILNKAKSGSSWSGWRRTLSKITTGDRRPDNL
jgi:hypothetical protein